MELGNIYYVNINYNLASNWYILEKIREREILIIFFLGILTYIKVVAANSAGEGTYVSAQVTVYETPGTVTDLQVVTAGLFFSSSFPLILIWLFSYFIYQQYNLILEAIQWW